MARAGERTIGAFLIASFVVPGMVSLLSLSGCADVPGRIPALPATERVQATASAYTAKARAAEGRGELRAALQQWWVVHATGVSRDEAMANIARLELSISRKVSTLMSASREAVDRGERSMARSRLLAALALDPKHVPAQEMLRKLEAQRVSATLASLPEGPPAPELADSSSDSSSVARNVAYGDAAQDAERAYQRGVSLYRSNKREAAAAFRQALERDPNHVKAKTYLRALERLLPD